MAMDLRELAVRQVRGIGPRKAEDLQALGIETAYDLLEYFPFRYEDYHIRDLAAVKDGEKVTVEGTIYGAPVLQMYGRKKSRLTCKVVVDPLMITAVWFNRHFIKDQLTTGAKIVLTGKWEQNRLQITVAEHEFPDRGGASRTGTLQPVYSVAGPVTQNWLRKTIRQVLAQYGQWVEEILPEELVKKYRLMPRERAVSVIHQPEDWEEGKQARRRIVYEELFLFQLKMQAFRALNRSKSDGVAHSVDSQAVREFVRSLPFVLTASQKNVIAEILEDLKQPYAMNRLLQGDVGSGKTVVAAVALFAVVKAGAQGALMVPTEILAEQHKRSLEKLFAPYGIQVGLLTGSLTERQRRDARASIQMGLTDIVVGTHALIQEDVIFHRLGLVVTDEQHRFGVNQRSILRRKGLHPDVLTMTATPIPRTLAITAFGDMDVSTLKELPKGRKPIKTYAVPHDMLERVLRFIRKEAAAGRQAYVICPLIEESDKLDVQNAIDVHAQLTHHFPDLSVGLLHGRLSNQDKEQIMAEFSDNRIQVLVSTTVVEVGVDVPNATLMVVYDAVRFGLSQLHQLRGRVGRGEHQSYCILIADPKNEISRERLKVMTETNDGFEIARRDLEIRGPGDFFGTKQSGLPEFKVADLMSDFEILEKAREDAAELVSESDFWTAARYLPLRDYLQRSQVFSGHPFD
ncbi:ATP-dependent DNA helicase RecG [Paenibacillus sp. J2TS4]|uniref:ATP-dependent DNA helicase RecG n=1 Tax=Paenibacillus sp. J2TS4 TaxID=2807194 RepID=UPI001B0203F1|nr:ATP-dependent DNA helicase RecG [Paenibacillus sp. J2TS4]GIP32964.1 ATP-dependent DNA helicase RecG [Paenibacillus sp. J2TS4]